LGLADISVSASVGVGKMLL